MAFSWFEGAPGYAVPMRILPLFIFWSLWFLNFSTRTAFSPILPQIEDSLRLSHGAAAGLYSSYAIGYGLTLFLAGRFASALGYKRMVAAGFGGMCLVLLGFQAAGSYGALHGLFLLLGVTTGTYLPSILPILTATYPPGLWGKVIGWHESAAGLAICSTPVLVSFGLRFLTWREVLLVLAAFAVLLPIVFWRVAAEPPGDPGAPRPSISGLLGKREIWAMAFLWAIASASGMGVYSILPLYLVKERGIEFHFANILFGVSRIDGIVLPVVMGGFVDRYGYRIMIFLSLLVTGLSTVGLAMATSLPFITVVLVIQATVSVAFFPVGLAAISKLTSPRERSLAAGMIISAGVVLGLGITPFVLGWIADHLHFQAGILGLGIAVTFSSLAALSWLKD
jgi:MFS family permease